MLVVLGVFVLTIGIVLGTYWTFIVRPEGVVSHTVRERLKDRQRPKLSIAPLVKTEERLSTIGALDTALSRFSDATLPLRGLVVRSGLRVTIGTILLACLFLGVIGAGAAIRFHLPILAAPLLGVILGSLPILYLRRAANKRLAVFEEQFPEAIELIARALRAGHALTTALEVVGDEMAEPIGSEFRLMFDLQNYGMSLAQAMREFATRVPLLDSRFFVTAVLTQRETGGNLSEVLDNLASVIRERYKVKRQVRVVSAHGRITGLVLTILPPALAVVLLFLSPDHIQLLAQDPLGRQMVMGALVLEMIGFLAIRRIVNVEY